MTDGKNNKIRFATLRLPVKFYGMTFKKIFASIIIVLSLCILITLGIWQVQRLEWKNQIIADIQAQQSVDAATTPLDLTQQIEFQRGYIDGSFMMKKPIRVSPRTHAGAVGYHFITPFQTNGGQIILVNQGWVSNDVESIAFNTRNQKIMGYLKSPEVKGGFTPANRPDDNLWHSIDIDEVKSVYNFDQLHPQVFYMESPASDIIERFNGLPLPRNKHMQYALFWFGMAGLLIILSGIVVVSRSKKASSQG